MIPEELKKGKRWVNFRLMPDKDGGKPRKVPINPETGKNAASNKPETWTDYQTVADAVEMYGFTGIGRMFVKEDGFVGVDIDHCYDPETGQFNEIAAAILAKQPTFAEFSPSGDGVHLWFKGEKPKGSSKNSETGVEMYDSGRYFTVTGKKLPDAPETVAQDNGTLAWIHENYVSKKRGPKAKTKKKNPRRHRRSSQMRSCSKRRRRPRAAMCSRCSGRADGRRSIRASPKRTWHSV